MDEKLQEIEDSKDKSDESTWCSFCGKRFDWIKTSVKYPLKTGAVWRHLTCPDPRALGTEI